MYHIEILFQFHGLFFFQIPRTSKNNLNQTWRKIRPRCRHPHSKKQLIFEEFFTPINNIYPGLIAPIFHFDNKTVDLNCKSQFEPVFQKGVQVFFLNVTHAKTRACFHSTRVCVDARARTASRRVPAESPPEGNKILYYQKLNTFLPNMVMHNGPWEITIPGPARAIQNGLCIFTKKYSRHFPYLDIMDSKRAM